MRRRQSLRLSAALAVSSPALLRGEHLSTIGVQLVSVPQELVADPDLAFATLAAIGYKEVEIWLPQTGAPDLAALRALLDKHHLAIPSRHWSPRDIKPENLPRVLRESEILGKVAHASGLPHLFVEDERRDMQFGHVRAAFEFLRQIDL